MWKLYFKDEDKLNKGTIYKIKVWSLLDRLGIKFEENGF